MKMFRFLPEAAVLGGFNVFALVVYVVASFKGLQF